MLAFFSGIEPEGKLRESPPSGKKTPITLNGVVVGEGREKTSSVWLRKAVISLGSNPRPLPIVRKSLTIAPVETKLVVVVGRFIGR